MSYLPLWMPGMIVSKVALISLGLSPSIWLMAVARSASMPTMVEPFERDELVGCVGGVEATSRSPFDLTEAGTVAAMAALVAWVGMTVVGRATVAVVEELRSSWCCWSCCRRRPARRPIRWPPPPQPCGTSAEFSTRCDLHVRSDA